MPDTIVRFVELPGGFTEEDLESLWVALDRITHEEAFSQLLEKARRTGLGAWGKEIVARDLSKPELDRAATQMEEIWARSHATTRTALLEEEKELFQAELSAHLQHYLRTFQAGHRTLGSTEWWLKRELRLGYERQFILGLEAAGKFRPPTKAELRYLRGMRYRDFGFLRGFLADVRDGKGRMDYADRLDLYAQGGRQAYWAGIVFGTPGGKCLKWVLGAAEHCVDCAHLAVGGPWKRGVYYRRDLLRMGVFPGGHRLNCYRNCKCHLEAVDKPGRRPPWTAPKGRARPRIKNHVD